MPLRDNPLGELKVPLTWTAGIAFIVVLIVAVAALLSDRREAFDTDEYGNPRTLSDRVLAPVGEIASAPGRLTGQGVEGVRGYFFAVSENRRLREELEKARRWQEIAVSLQDTNERYRAILGLKTDPPIPMASARVVTDSRGPFAQSRLANAGTERGIKPGNPVMSENGLIGRVVGAGQDVSRILLLTDPASRTPVMIDRTNSRAILTGDGGPNPRLEYLRGSAAVREGDVILTSGDGGLLPRGLPVGVAVRGLDGRWRVALAADKAPVDYVRILLFEDFTQLARTQNLTPAGAPPPTPGAETLPPPPRLVAPPPTAATPAPKAGASAPAASPARGGATPPAKAPPSPGGGR
ncbi:rod shape-determining protein MreC [Phenylobacterium sp. SCN 70-31]|uniref:rod shape-determining protein MreC n=1 Tax=Phenylobacterium sp. SCN 70-31 TaxID=1660129 RepID=UPI00086DFBE5|nr:rod shape-determining protein MreC [Phenylobacterium sp. SCN 70-31]ODT87681.1 MAG: rod shape-determining protein MreC [Phenylobacterium sp. SCN 70-31]